jgi:hypothetical protein
LKNEKQGRSSNHERFESLIPDIEPKNESKT